ncbi:MAG: hypothetical protein AAGF12_04790 [Myxococcota bacterium]
MKTERVVVVGAGGFARELRWLIQELAGTTRAGGVSYEVVGFVTSSVPERPPRDWLGDFDWLEKEQGKYDRFGMGIGNPQTRERLFRELESIAPEDRWPAFIHPTARFDAGTCRIGYGTAVCAGTIITVDAVVEPLALLNLNVTVGHDATVGRASVLNPTVNVSGAATIGRCCLIGTGAQLLQGVHVADGGTVGAGAVVRQDVEPNQTVVGVPAKPIRR